MQCGDEDILYLRLVYNILIRGGELSPNKKEGVQICQATLSRSDVDILDMFVCVRIDGLCPSYECVKQ